MAYDAQARELNDIIGTANRNVFKLLSEKGRAIFFPKKGILAQTAEANGKEINATIGTALEDNGKPMCLESLSRQFNIQDKRVFAYAPSPGRPEIRSAWRDMMLKKNPGLKGKNFGLPVVSSALTHGLSMAGYLFCDPGDDVIMPDLYWENYDLVLSRAYGARITTFPMFAGGRFNVAGLRTALKKSRSRKKIVLLNFPNNPTGYTATVEEGRQIRQVLVEAADRGAALAVFLDDAYFGLVYEQDVMVESLFADLCDAHERILAVKFDGPTKEDYVWGFRVGFVTFGTARNSPQLYTALEAKLAGAIRGSISNASNVGQTLLLAAYSDPNYDTERTAKFGILKRRYEQVKKVFADHPEYAEFFEPLPYNSGYFMCVRMKSGDAEPVRQVLLNKYSTGVIAFGAVMRIAFSSTPLSTIERLFHNIYWAAKETKKP